MKLFMSIGLILGMLGVWVIVGPMICSMIWTIILGLFLISRFTKRVHVFTEWSWPQFLMTIGFGLGIPYMWMLLSAGF